MGTFHPKDEILKEHSRAQRDRIVAWVGLSQKRFDILFDLFLQDEYRVTQRAAWPLSYCSIAQPKFIKKRLPELIKNLYKPSLQDSIKRNTVRILEQIDIPKEFQGDVMNICFQYVESPTEAVAIKAFSLTILGKLAREFPDILPEIELLIREQMPGQTAAFKSRAKKLLKAFGKS